MCRSEYTDSPDLVKLMHYVRENIPAAFATAFVIAGLIPPSSARSGPAHEFGALEL